MSISLRNHKKTFLRKKKTITRRKTCYRKGLLSHLFREISAAIQSLYVRFWLMSPEKRWHVGLVTPVIQGQYPSALGSSSVCVPALRTGSGIHPLWQAVCVRNNPLRFPTMASVNLTILANTNSSRLRYFVRKNILKYNL